MKRLLVVGMLLLVSSAPEAQQKIAPPPPAAEQPFSLSDPDGQELILEELNARAAVHGMLSLTELEFRFRNPQAKRIEGRFNCVLPPNAAISRFAKEVNGQLMEGEVVERLRANQVYEQFLHQMRDPALLEQDQGNRFSARIFPIEAHASVRILISYSALLPLHDGARTYTLPLRGLPKVNKLTFRGLVQALPGESSSTGSDALTHTAADVITLDKRDYVPEHDISMTWHASNDAPRARVLRAGDFYLASFRPELASRAAAAPHAWLLFADTSASSADGAEHRIHALETLLRSMPSDDRVRVEAFDQEIVTLGTGTASEMSRSIAALLRARLFLGGTDLAALMRHAAKEAAAHPDHGVIIASDFVATLGATERRDVEEAAHAFPARTTLHALILGSREEAAIAKAITAGRGRVIHIPFTEGLEARAKDAADDVRRPLGSAVDLRDANAEWVYPTHFDDVQNGDEIVVVGKTKAAMDPAIAVGDLKPESTTLSASNFGPLLEREGWRAYLDYLAEREAGEASDAVRQALATEEVKISVEQRVVIPRTTMLVLESEWDYQRFGLDRRALAAILTVGAGGIERMDRRTTNPAQITAPPALPPPPKTRTQNAPTARAAGAVADGAGSPPPVENKDWVTVSMFAEGRYTLDFDTAWLGTGVSAPIGPAPNVTASSPVPQQIAAPPPPEPQREERRASDAAWNKSKLPSHDEIERLQSKLKESPSDRALYNQLSEAFAATGNWSSLRRLALDWQPYDAGNPQVYEVLGLADEHLGNMAEAARANASIIEVAPAKPELLQRAGLLLLRDGRAALAETPLRHALELRPDRVNGYRHLALLLWRQDRPEEAARVLESATRQRFPAWYGDAQRVVREELGYVYRAWLGKEPSKKNEIEDRAREYNVDLARHDALRVTLAWETDANDVDLHVVDPRGEECYYGHTGTATGLELYEDITQGLGPEVIRTAKAAPGKYDVGVRYFAAGPMGVSRGIVVVMRGEDVLEILPFRLIEGGGEIRYLTTVTVK